MRWVRDVIIGSLSTCVFETRTVTGKVVLVLDLELDPV